MSCPTPPITLKNKPLIVIPLKLVPLKKGKGNPESISYDINK
jgi:hypothetical protein